MKTSGCLMTLILSVTVSASAQAPKKAASTAKKPKGPVMPRPVERKTYPAEAFMEAPPVTLLNVPAKPAPVRAMTPTSPGPEYSLKGVDLKDPVPVSAVPTGLIAIPAPSPLPKVETLVLPEMKSVQENPVGVDHFSKDVVQMFEAYVMLNDQKKPLPAYGAFARLTRSKEKFRDSARWGFAQAALALGLRVQYESTLLEMMERPSSPWTVKAYEDLVANSDATKSVWVHSMSEKYLSHPPSAKTTDAFYLLRALRFSAVKSLDQALQDLSQIKKGSPLYGHRVYQEALILYRRGKLGLALEALRAAFTKDAKIFEDDTDLKTKAALLWGRLAFQSREFKQAFEAYRTVPRTSPLWPEAMMEQALTQVLFKDYEGAAGNMFTLHTDYFKKSYAPESYLIRTVGYLNLCQYADALKAVQELQRKYKPILEAVTKYNKKANADSDYDLIRQFAKNPAVRDVNGIARPFLFAWAQDSGFERHQERINQIEDELTAFQNLSLKIVKRERELTQKVVDLNQKLGSAGAKTDAKLLASYEAELASVKFEQRMMQDARKSLQNIRGDYLAEMDGLKSQRRSLAARSLSQKRTSMVKSLRHLIDQSDVLLYEIYSGAGDQLRYAAAGGKVEEKSSEKLKGLKDDAVKWKFKGEIWEDELGHFRSSLTNVCTGEDEAPKRATASTSKGDL